MSRLDQLHRRPALRLDLELAPYCTTGSDCDTSATQTRGIGSALDPAQGREEDGGAELEAGGESLRVLGTRIVREPAAREAAASFAEPVAVTG